MHIHVALVVQSTHNAEGATGSNQEQIVDQFHLFLHEEHYLQTRPTPFSEKEEEDDGLT
jgi:hypothetical protein